jgi:hypothetical protein
MYSPLAVMLVLAFMLWFAAGIQWNLRKGNALLRWLQSGLPALGKRTTLRWLGSSVVELKITDPAEPFLEAEVLVVLEPRDVGPLWGWGRLHGRRDFLIVRARLQQPPRFEVEVGDRRGWTGRDALARLALREWRQADWGDANIQVAYSGDRAPEIAHQLWRNFESTSGGIWRLSVRRTRPHLEVHLIPPDATAIPADRLFQTFRDLSEAVV